MDIEITKETNLHYDYWNPTEVNFNGRHCYYYENRSSLDKYQILEDGTDRVIVCSETKELLIDYLISQNAKIINS